MLMKSLPVTLQQDVPFPAAIFVALVLGVLLGLVSLYLFGEMYRWVGHRLGGQANRVETRAVIGWSQVPTIWLFGLWLTLLLASGGELLLVSEKHPPTTALVALFSLVFVLANLIVIIWRFVVTCKAIAEVYRFSDWKGLKTLLIPHALLIVPLFILGLLLSRAK